MKRLFAFALVVVMALSMVACQANKPNATDASGNAKPGNVTLNVVTSYGGDDGNRQHFQDAVAAYEKATGNKVNDGSATSNEEWKAKVQTDFETGSEPDVLFFFTNADAEPFIGKNKVVSIEEIRKEYPNYASNMKDNMMAVAADGKHYAVPSAGFWENMFVNKTVLKAAGVEIPGADYTWNQFIEDCKKIKAAGYTPIACSLFEVPHYWFEFMVMNNGTLADQLQVPTLDANGKLNNDAVAQKWIAALKDIKELYDLGFFPENTLTAKDADTVAMFGEGEAAFLIDGSWKCGYFSENHKDELDNFTVSYVPGKGARPATDMIGGISMGYFITRKAWEDPAKREAAVKFVEHLTSDSVLSTFVTTEVTALKNGAKPTGLNKIQQAAADANAKVTGVVGAVQDTITGECKTDLFANIQKIVTGEMTPEQALESALKLNKK